MSQRIIISAIVAMSENRVIGKNNQLPWHLPGDLRHFKTLTTGHAIIMGRKTFASIGKPLPNRINIVITRDRSFVAPGCTVVNSLADAINYAKEHEQKEIFIIGGAEIFAQSLAHVERIYLTIVHHHFDGDVFFPELDKNDWQETQSEYHAADKENAYAFSFVTLERKE